MSRFKNEITHLQAHIKTLRLAAGALVVVALVMGGGWWSAPRDLTIHVPPDLRSGSTRKWWEVPPESVYAFTFYVFQTLNRWPTNGEEDYARNLHTLSPYLTPSCQAFLRADYDYRRSTGELRQRAGVGRSTVPACSSSSTCRVFGRRPRHTRNASAACSTSMPQPLCAAAAPRSRAQRVNGVSSFAYDMS